MNCAINSVRPFKGDKLTHDKFVIVMQSYPPRALERRLQEDWTKDAREGPRVLMSLGVDFRPMG